MSTTPLQVNGHSSSNCNPYAFGGALKNQRLRLTVIVAAWEAKRTPDLDDMPNLLVERASLVRYLQARDALGTSMFRRTTTHSTAAMSGTLQPCRRMAGSSQVQRIVSHHLGCWLSITVLMTGVRSVDGIPAEWTGMYNPTAEEAERDRRAACESGVPHGMMRQPSGDVAETSNARCARRSSDMFAWSMDHGSCSASLQALWRQAISTAACQQSRCWWSASWWVDHRLSFEDCLVTAAKHLSLHIRH